MPIENRLRRDEERRPSFAGHEPGEQRNDGPVRPVETRTGDLAAEHCQLVTQHEDLGVLCDVVHPVDAHESECAVSQAVEEGEDHGELASPSELLLVKLAAGSSWTLQAKWIGTVDSMVSLPGNDLVTSAHVGTDESSNRSSPSHSNKYHACLVKYLGHTASFPGRTRTTNRRSDSVPHWPRPCPILSLYVDSNGNGVSHASKTAQKVVAKERGSRG